jgi:hypothetical protein
MALLAPHEFESIGFMMMYESTIKKKAYFMTCCMITVKELGDSKKKGPKKSRGVAIARFDRATSGL